VYIALTELRHGGGISFRRVGKSVKPTLGTAMSLLLGFFAVALSSGPTVADVTFQGLGFIAGFDYSEAVGVSADGSVVAGNVRPIGNESNGNSQAYSWTSTTGMAGLGYPAGSNMSRALGVGGDGSTIVGYSQLLSNNGPNSGSAAFSWTSANGFAGLGTLPGASSLGFATSASATGSFIVGAAAGPAAMCCGAQAIRWTSATGMVNLGVIPGATGAVANSVNADGSVVVGYTANNQAFLWTAATGMTGLGFLPGSASSNALAVSANGSVVVGTSGDPQEAFMWTAAGGMVGLGFLPGAVFSIANAVSGDGSVIVGSSGTNTILQAFIWTEATGVVSLHDLLVANGFELTGWTLESATGISTDGHVIIGNGIDPLGLHEAWMVQLSVAAGVPGPTVGAGLPGILVAIAGFIGWRRSRRGIRIASARGF
jgi:probable HAF family extracellular repeat protein